MENKREEMEIIVAVAIKTKEKEGEVFVSRYSHSELIVMFPDKFRNAKQGFLTSKCRFVDRKEALKIANRYNQIKDNTQNELYSENIFLNEHMQKDKIEKLQKENQNLKENYAEYVKKSCEAINKKLKEDYISVCNLYDIIKKLKIYNNEDNEKVKMYENIRRNISNNFYRKSHQIFIHKLNAQIRARKQVILLLNKLLNTKK